ncbi:MAG: tryptophanase [Candidatus Sericytochromatia bacterium]|nr:tryptophanase [Candidatus Sericytochromatia bacterium]
MKTIIEPFRIKSVEPIRMTTRSEREAILKTARYNLFSVPADDVLIDLLTDSGTGAMSAEQWAGVMRGDESYAGSRSFERFQATVQELTGMPHVLPTHQGRAAEKILFALVGGPGKLIPNNTHFDTTRANIEYTGATASDCLIPEGKIPSVPYPFKGNMDVAALVDAIKAHGPENVPLCMLTVTNNSSGGQPVSMANIQAVKAALAPFGIPLYLDCCRFAENAYFIQQREPGYADRTVKSIAQEMFSYADGALMSAKKDGLANIGGFLSLRADTLVEQARQLLILTEGFPTYGGLAGRDLEAIAQGLTEVVEEDYLRYRIRSVAYLGEAISKAGVPIIQPPGGHAVYIDAGAMLAHLQPQTFPGQSLACELYLEAGVRSCEIGSVMFGKQGPDGRSSLAPMELVRLAIPRRVYTQSHIDYLAEAIIQVYDRRHELVGYRIVAQPQFLRHFTAAFEPMTGVSR